MLENPEDRVLASEQFFRFIDLPRRRTTLANGLAKMKSKHARWKDGLLKRKKK